MGLPQVVAAVARATVVSALALSSLGVTGSTQPPPPPNEAPAATITSSPDPAGFAEDETIISSNEGGAIVTANDQPIASPTVATNDASTSNAPATATETSTEEPATTTPPSPTETSTPEPATATPPPPTETSTAEPATATPIPNSLTCDVPATTEIAPGQTAELHCAFTVNDPATAAAVTASFTNAPGDGWMLAFGDGPAGATAVWSPAAPLAVGHTMSVDLRVTAPADASDGQTASVSVFASDDSGAVATWLLTTVVPAESDGGFSIMSATGPCTQLSPAGNNVNAGADAIFRCAAYEARLKAVNMFFAGPNPNWEYRVEGMPAGQYITSGGYNATALANMRNQGQFEVRIRTKPSINPNESINLIIQYLYDSCFFGGCSTESFNASALYLTWPAPSSSCNRLGPAGATIGPGEYATFRCTYSNPPYRAERGGNGPGAFQWTFSFGTDPVATPTGWGRSAFSVDSPAEGGNAFYVYLRHDPTASASSAVSYFLLLRMYEPGASYRLTNEILEVTYVPATTCDPTAALTAGADFGGSHWVGDHYAPATADLSIAIAPSTSSGCGAVSDGWSVSLRSSGLYKDGDTENGLLIPPGAITFQGTTENGSQPAGLTPTAPTALDPASPVTIATGNANGAGVWDVALQLQPPDDAPPGDYSGSIVITIASGS